MGVYTLGSGNDFKVFLSTLEINQRDSAKVGEGNIISSMNS